MGRAPCCDKANVKKGPWSPEEDAKLKSYIEKHGTGGNWIALPHKIGLKRCGKSCRLRWLNYLRPNIRHGGFSEEEDEIICSLYLSIGSRWSIIASQLPGRTDNDIKNYWNTRLKKKLLGKQLRKEPLNSNCLRSSDHSNYVNMMKQKVNKGSIANSLVTGNISNIDDHNQKPYWAMDVHYDLPNQSSSFKDFLFKLDGRFSSEEDKQGLVVDGTSFGFQQLYEQLKNIPSSSSLASSVDYIPQFFPTQFGTENNETGFQGMQGQSEITYSDDFLYSDSVTCGESNSIAWGYFTSLMALPPPSSSDHCNHTLFPEILQQNCAYGSTGLRYEDTQL